MNPHHREGGLFLFGADSVGIGIDVIVGVILSRE